MSTWQDRIPTEGSVELLPDRRALDGLGRNHSLESALADLVDNSIDAGASNVLIRFIQVGLRLVGIYVVDDGRGMEPDQIDSAMTIGGRRQYSDKDLGQFGLGLKAASFSQARSLTVFSRAAMKPAVGRRWLLNQDREGFHCDRVTPEFAAAELDRGFPVDTTSHGTVVRWDEITTFPNTGDVETLRTFVTRKLSAVQGHLGLMFHRLIAAGRVSIILDVEDVTSGETGPPLSVAPLDPFAYPSTLSGWPKSLSTTVNGRHVVFRCHIWPARSNLPGFRLPGGVDNRQGLYFYRRDRLLHAGGWEGITTPDKALQVARVEVDIDGDVHGLFRVNPEKTRITVGPMFSTAVTGASASDGTTIFDYLRVVEEYWTTAHKRQPGRRDPVLPPGKGLHEKLRRVISDELPLLPDEPLDIIWERFDDDQFIDFDKSRHTIRLNSRYRPSLLAGRRGGLSDLPVLKAALFLLVEARGVTLFHGDKVGARDKDHIELFTEVLTAAAKAERAMYEERA